MGSSTSSASSAQGLFETEMAQSYSPNSPFSRKRWDPVLHTWRQSKAVQLFSPKNASKADAIFGEGAANEIYTPHNGLFLHEMVEHALTKGYIAIVPDGKLDGLINYKVVVLDKQCREVQRWIGRSDVDGFKRYIDLDERQLRFKTDARPKMRYVWWTYLNAVLRTFYWADSYSDYGNINRCQEVRWLDSYWKHHGPFAKRNQLMWFVRGSGPNWTAAFLHGFEEEGDTLTDKEDLERIFRDDHCQRKYRSVPEHEYEEIDSSDEGDTEEQEQNGEKTSGINDTAGPLAPNPTFLQRHRNGEQLTSADLLREMDRLVGTPIAGHEQHMSSGNDMAMSRVAPGEVGTELGLVVWGERASGDDSKKTVTTTVTTTTIEGEKTTTKTEVTETTTTVTTTTNGDDGR
ncbi:hypothetical protein FIE12Z_3398 [Fusarium flagelliforme]|uniref:HNH nuclease domain-containing protein n=1 Tax=Fusarium flagelliforme TaxID=2675880 RepID=A0A395MWN8_9HYPO|nr:hypothetical protein FIE12Z_3398 [Fusarium flagelliforme]